jgi:hypothetical protein
MVLVSRVRGDGKNKSRTFSKPHLAREYQPGARVLKLLWSRWTVKQCCVTSGPLQLDWSVRRSALLSRPVGSGELTHVALQLQGTTCSTWASWPKWKRRTKPLPHKDLHCIPATWATCSHRLRPRRHACQIGSPCASARAFPVRRAQLAHDATLLTAVQPA